MADFDMNDSFDNILLSQNAFDELINATQSTEIQHQISNFDLGLNIENKENIEIQLEKDKAAAPNADDIKQNTDRFPSLEGDDLDNIA